MPSYDSLSTPSCELVTIDPMGWAAFLGVPRGMNREERAQVSVRAIISGLHCWLCLPSPAPKSCRCSHHARPPRGRRFLLFFIAFEMVFGGPPQDRRKDLLVASPRI